jgi:hypothetical protein
VIATVRGETLDHVFGLSDVDRVVREQKRVDATPLTGRTEEVRDRAKGLDRRRLGEADVTEVSCAVSR